MNRPMTGEQVGRWVNWLTFRLLIIIMVGCWVYVLLQRQEEEPEYKIRQYQKPSEREWPTDRKVFKV